MSDIFMGITFHLKSFILRHGLLLIVGMWFPAHGSAMECPPQCCCPAAPKPKWHSVVMMPRTNLPPIHFYNKINPLWWFGNVDEPQPPAWYRPGSRCRNVAWHFRNPLANFSNYVIGIGDKKSIRSGRYPTQLSKPGGGWNYAVSRRHILYLPFLDYKRGRFEFYFGWRERGNFGIKLNFRQALPRHGQQNSTNAPPVLAGPVEIPSQNISTNSRPLSTQSKQPLPNTPLEKTGDANAGSKSYRQ